MAQERLEEIRNLRLQKRQQLIDAGLPPYPAEVRRTHTVAQAFSAFEELSTSKQAIIVVGRIMSIRRHGGVAFLDLRDTTGSLQLQATKDELPEELFARLDLLDVGDWAEATGSLIKTQRGIQTLQLSNIVIISKAIRPLPDAWYGLKDHEARFRQRELDLLLNEKVRDVFEKRSRIINWLRKHMQKQGYLEVDVPVLQSIPGGAMAKPFTTHHNALDVDLYLRIASELYLKRLLAAGFEKVFEIGVRFRNEGIDREHNPEFTMLESQWAYADYEDLMDFTEATMQALVEEIAGDATVTWQDQSLNFERPFARLRYIDAVSEKVGFDILEEKDPRAYIEVFEKEGLVLPEAQTYVQLVDELYKKLIRPGLIQPTLVYDYPAEMVPLAKQDLHDPRVAEKFQTLVAGMEINNCYTELNDPVIQRAKLMEQQQAKDAGDIEAHSIDEEYLRAMEYGMPPNAGWSLGIDRVVMLLTNSSNIRDVILFPLLRPEHD